MKNLALIFAFFVILSFVPVYAGGLSEPKNVRVQTAKCDVNASDHYFLLTWDEVKGADSYEIYGKPVNDASDFTDYGYTISTQHGQVIRKNTNYIFYVVAKAGEYKSEKSSDYFLTTQTIELACKTARENKSWYELRMISPVSGNYKVGDEIKVVWDFDFSQPNKQFTYGDFISRVYLYDAKDANKKYYEITVPTGKPAGNSQMIKLGSDIPTGYYRARVVIDVLMGDINDSESYPFADSANELYIVNNHQPLETVITPTTSTATITQPAITLTISQTEGQQLRKEINILKNQINQTTVQQNSMLKELNSLKGLVQSIINKIFGGIFHK